MNYFQIIPHDILGELSRYFDLSTMFLLQNTDYLQCIYRNDRCIKNNAISNINNISLEYIYHLINRDGDLKYSRWLLEFLLLWLSNSHHRATIPDTLQRVFRDSDFKEIKADINLTSFTDIIEMKGDNFRVKLMLFVLNQVIFITSWSPS